MNEPKANHNEGWLDKLAISMAVLCAIHCLIVPVMIVAVPLISSISDFLRVIDLLLFCSHPNSNIMHKQAKYSFNIVNILFKV